MEEFLNLTEEEAADLIRALGLCLYNIHKEPRVDFTAKFTLDGEVQEITVTID